MSISPDFPAETPIHELEARGFRIGEKGTHSSRTIMLEELRLLLAECPPNATREDYAAAIIDRNCLGKRTESVRRSSNQRLGELYSLHTSVALFSVFRELWYFDTSGRPLLALLLALARDPLLRFSATSVLRLRPGEEFTRPPMDQALRDAVGERMNDNIRAKVMRNAASSWTQAGHLEGRVRKIRHRVAPTPFATAYALFLGYAAGLRGTKLFSTPWMRVLDANYHQHLGLAAEAHRIGLLDLRQAGGVVDISFRHFSEYIQTNGYGKN